MFLSILSLCLLALTEVQSPPPGAIPLWEGLPPESVEGDAFKPWLEVYRVEGTEPRGAVLICPGGGYSHRAGHEAEPIARSFNAQGIHGFVVQYRVSPNRHPAPLYDAGRALRIIRANAESWRVKPDKIAVLGFSAGGHLAGTLGVHYDEAAPPGADPLNQVSCRPDSMVLCYPVIFSGDWAHTGTMFALLGEKNSKTLSDYLSVDRYVTKDTPPTFLWHAVSDDLVPVLHSIVMANALSEKGVPFELHVYAEGSHGMGLAEGNAHVSTWMELCCQWLKGMGW